MFLRIRHIPSPFSGLRAILEYRSTPTDPWVLVCSMDSEELGVLYGASAPDSPIEL